MLLFQGFRRNWLCLSNLYRQIIAVHGLLPPIPVDASESDVRREICEVIRSCSDYAECSPDDFIDMINGT